MKKKIYLVLIISCTLLAGLFSITKDEQITSLVQIENEIQFSLCKVKTFREHNYAFEENQRIIDMHLNTADFPVTGIILQTLGKHHLNMESWSEEIKSVYIAARTVYNKKLMEKIYENPLDLSTIKTAYNSMNLLGTEMEPAPELDKYIRNTITYMESLFKHVDDQLKKLVTDKYTYNRLTVTEDKIKPVFEALKIKDPYVQFNAMKELEQHDYFQNNQQFLYYLNWAANNLGNKDAVEAVSISLINNDNGLFKTNTANIEALMTLITMAAQNKDYKKMADLMTELEENTAARKNWIEEYFKAVAYMELNMAEKAAPIIAAYTTGNPEIKADSYEIAELFGFLHRTINNTAPEQNNFSEVTDITTDRIIKGNVIRRVLYGHNIIKNPAEPKAARASTWIRTTVDNKWLKNKYTKLICVYTTRDGREVIFTMNKTESDENTTVFETMHIPESYVNPALRLKSIIIKNPLYPVTINYNGNKINKLRTVKNISPVEE